MVSKKLDSILSKYPHATATNNATEVVIREEKIEVEQNKFKAERLVAEIPYDLKIQIKKYLADNLGDTERTVVLKGLKLLGFKVDITEFKDKRGRRG